MRETARRLYRRLHAYVTDPDRWDELAADRRKGGLVGMQATYIKLVLEFQFWLLTLAPVGLVVYVVTPAAVFGVPRWFYAGSALVFAAARLTRWNWCMLSGEG